MKIKKDYVLQKIADEFVVVPVAEEADRLHGVIRLSETGAFLWECLEKGIQSEKELESAIMREYDVDKSTVHNDIARFLQQLESFGCFDN